MSQKCRNISWSQKEWCNKHKELQFQSILNTENVDALKTLQINRSRLYNLATCALGDSLVHKQWHVHQVVEIQKETSAKMYTPY